MVQDQGHNDRTTLTNMIDVMYHILQDIIPGTDIGIPIQEVTLDHRADHSQALDRLEIAVTHDHRGSLPLPSLGVKINSVKDQQPFYMALLTDLILYFNLIFSASQKATDDGRLLNNYNRC